MTLRQQFSLLTSALVIVLLAGSLLLTVKNGRDGFQQQLNARAYDAATSLALSMSRVDGLDPVKLSRQIDALFDRGFFADITFTGVGGNELHRRARQALSESPAPQWFMSEVTFDMLPAEADVMVGWQQLGTVRVSSHTDFAYRDMWDMVKAEAIWFALVLLVSLALLHILLGWLFKPVMRVEQQALAICERDWQIQENIPRARELRRMVLAMNKMVSKLHALFTEQSATTERLRQESFHDAATGLLNRRGFDQRLDHVLQGTDEHSGVLMLLQVEHFAEYNQREGRQAGDDVIQLVAQSLQQWHLEYQNSVCGRHAGADFALYAPCASRGHADELLQSAFGQLATTALNQRTGLNFHLGGVFLQGDQDVLGSALSRADAALRQAQRHSHARAILYQEDRASQPELTGGQWSALLKSVLQNNHLSLQFMPVIKARGDARELLQLEVYSRIERDGQSMSAARFWPMVEQHQMAAAFDISVIRKVMLMLQNEPLRSNARICINLSPASVIDNAFHQDLVQLIRQYPQQAHFLALEVPEYCVRNAEAELVRLAGIVRPFGVVLGIDQVGTGTVAFSYMKRLPLEYVRIDGSLNRGLHLAQDQRFFIQSMIQIGHKLDLLVLGEGVEVEADVDELGQSGIDGISGYYYSRPFGSLAGVEQWLEESDS